MKILHILKIEPDETVKKIIEEHKKTDAVTIVELYKKDKNYEEIINLIEKSDRVFTW